MISFWRAFFNSLPAGGLLVVSLAFARPPMRSTWTKRVGTPNVTNMVAINGFDGYCLITPKDLHTNIGDSEYPGGTMTYCTTPARTSDEQGTIPAAFWKNVEFTSGTKAGFYVQLTGCIDSSVLDRLNSDDSGGQYDSSGGPGGEGNPVGSVCTGYNHYVELIEPAVPRACIRCCDDPADCPTHQDKTGCPNVIPGNYFDCA